MTLHTMDCAALDERLADYLEGDLDAARRREVEAHVASCVRCAALVRELQSIRAGAAELPELTPSRDLWSGIARRIDTPVVPFAPRPAPNVFVARPAFDRLKRAAIAAALVIVTAGVTYTLTVARNGARPSTENVASTSGRAARDTNRPVPASDAAPRQNVTPTPELANTEPPAGNSQAQRVANDSRGSAPKARDEAASDTYSREIDRLRTIFARNRSQLDPRTAAIIEANLKVIDEAIAQSKAALAQDPASRFLSNQLNSALDKKLELLRTAALLPNRT